MGENYIKKDKLSVRKYENRKLMGQAAAEAVSETIQKLLLTQKFVNIIFAAAPSQNEFLEALVLKDLEWNRINAFHMDEYCGLQPDAPQTFQSFLKERIFNKRNFLAVHYLEGSSPDAATECKRYSALLENYPADIVCMGIGENGHIAFNDPHLADFEDKILVKVVDLDPVSRQQQVNDGCFPDISKVPVHALTLTIPAMMKATYIFCMVPGPKKATAVFNTLHQDIHPDFPSTVLRRHNHSILFLDEDSAKQLSA